eukprot:678618-Amphidinium_carterae.1
MLFFAARVKNQISTIVSVARSGVGSLLCRLSAHSPVVVGGLRLVDLTSAPQSLPSPTIHLVQLINHIQTRWERCAPHDSAGTAARGPACRELWGGSEISMKHSGVGDIAPTSFRGWCRGVKSASHG